VRDDIGVRHRFILRNSRFALLVKKFLEPSPSRMILRSAIQDALSLTVYESVRNSMALNHSVTAFINIFVKELRNRMILSSGDASLLTTELTGGENRMILRSSSPSVELFMPVMVNHRFMLSTLMGSRWLVHKYPAISHSLILSGHVAETIFSYINQIESTMVLSHAANTILSRYRLLYEMDDLPLGDFNDMELQYVDLIEIA